MAGARALEGKDLNLSEAASLGLPTEVIPSVGRSLCSQRPFRVLLPCPVMGLGILEAPLGPQCPV